MAGEHRLEVLIRSDTLVLDCLLAIALLLLFFPVAACKQWAFDWAMCASI